MAQRWRIQGYDGMNLIHEQILSGRLLSEARIISLLQRLAAQHLSQDEVIDASRPPKAAGYRPLLEARRNFRRGQRSTITVGENPHYNASIWSDEDLAAKGIKGF